MGPEDSLLEAGLAFTCAWDKPGGFIGREALREQKEAGVRRRRLVSFILEDAEPLLYHNEPIYCDGELVSFTTSAGYAHTLAFAGVTSGVLSVKPVHPVNYVPARYSRGAGHLLLGRSRRDTS